MDKTEQHKKAMLDALEKSLGVVTAACKAVGIGRTCLLYTSPSPRDS